MPEVLPIIDACPGQDGYRYDVKVHMLMPGQWPCIPGWHCDFVPRDEDKTLRPDLIDDDAPPMYLWVSGHPLTEFRDTGLVPAGAWVPFTQRDEHRGRKSEQHTWRLFIRAAHESIIPPHALEIAGLRRHCQVYTEPDFDW